MMNGKVSCAGVSLDICSGGLSNDLVRQLPVVRTSGTASSGKLEPVTVKAPSARLMTGEIHFADSGDKYVGSRVGNQMHGKGKIVHRGGVKVERTKERTTLP
ncbi:unnamed protein product [Ectocarpus sp. 8 AP-2014]